MKQFKKIFTFTCFLYCFICVPNVKGQNCTVNAGVPISWCPGETMTLYGNVTGLYNGSTITWSQVSGPAVTIANTHSLTTTCGTATAGSTYVFRISAQCQDNTVVTNDVTYTVEAATPTPPAANAGPTIDAGCKLWGQSIQLNATPATTGFIGTWSVYTSGGSGYPGGSFDNPNSPTAIFTPVQTAVGNPMWTCPATSYSFYLKWTLVSTIPPTPQCPSAQTSTSSICYVHVKMYNPVDAQAYIPCGVQVTDVYLYGTCPGGGTATWSLVSGPSGYSFTSVNAQNVTLSYLAAGTYTFRYTVTGTCVNGTKDVTFTKVAGSNIPLTTANANAGNMLTGYCGNLPSTIQLGANSVNVGETGTWTQSGGGTTVSISDIHNPNATASGLTIAGAPYKFTWTISNASGCSSYSTVSIVAVGNINIAPMNLTTPCNTPTYPASGAGMCYGVARALPVAYNAISPGLPVNGGWYIKGFILNTKPPGSPCTLGYTPSQTISYNHYGEGTHLAFASDCAGPGLVFTLSWSGGVSSSLGIYCHSPYTPGVYTGTLIYKNSYCGLEINVPFNFNITLSPSLSNAGTDQNLACNVVQTNLAGNDPQVTTPYFGQGTWDQINGPNTATIADINNRSSLVSSLIPGTYSFSWRIKSGDVCPAKQDTVFVRVSNAPPLDITAGPDQNVCYGTPVTLTADLVPSGDLANMITSSGSIGTWTQVSGPSGAVITTPNTITTTVTGTVASSTYVFRFTVTNQCGTKQADVSITTGSSQGASQANAGTNQCLAAGITTFNLSATAPASGTGLWTKINAANPGTITSPSSNTTTVTGVSPNGVYGYIYTITGGGCNSTVDTVFISNMGPLSAANAGPDQDICAVNGITSFSLAATTPTNGSGIWSQISGPQGASYNRNINNPVVTIAADGQYIFRWTVSNGACTPLTDDVKINFYTRPDLAVVLNSDTTICGNTGGQLQIRANAAAQGSWTLLTNGPGTITSNTSAVTTAKVNPGTTTIRWSVTSPSSACPSSYDDVVINYIPSAYAGTDKSYCNVRNVLLKSSDPGAGTGVWSTMSQPSGSSVVIFTGQGNDTTYLAGPLSSGSYTFRWTVTDAICGVTTDDVVIINDDIPSTPDAGSDFCSVTGSAMLLNGNAIPSGVTASWTRIAAPSGALAGTFTNAATANATYSISPYSPSYYPAGVYNFKYTFIKGSCSLSDYVSSRAVTLATAGSNQIKCNYSGVFTMNASVPVSSAGETGTWTVLAGSPVISNIHLYNTTVTVAIGDSVSLKWQITGQDGCVSNSSVVALVNKQVSAGTDKSLCVTLPGGTVTMSGSGTGGTWTARPGNPGSATITTPASPTTTITNFSVAGSYYFIWTFSTCKDTAIVNVSAGPAIPLTGTVTQPDCNTPTGSVVLNNLPSGSWTIDPGSISGTGTSSTITGLSSGTYNFTVTNSGGCTSSPSASVIINPQPSQASPVVETITQPSCNVSTGSVTLTGLPSGAWTLNPGNISGTGSTITVTGLAEGTYTFSVTNSSGCISPPSAEIVINLPPNCNPLAVNDNFSTNENLPLTGDASLNDMHSMSGGDVWTLIGNNGGAARGTVTMNNNGTFTYIYNQNAHYSGIDVFNYRICDMYNNCSSATVTITINIVGGPVANNDANTTYNNTLISGSVIGNDYDNYPLTVTPASGTAGGIGGHFSINSSGNYTYTPPLNTLGVATFTYQLCNNQGECDTATVRISCEGCLPPGH